MALPKRISKEDRRNCFRLLRKLAKNERNPQKARAMSVLGSFSIQQIRDEIKNNTVAGRELLKVLVNYIRNEKKARKKSEVQRTRSHFVSGLTARGEAVYAQGKVLPAGATHEIIRTGSKTVLARRRFSVT